RCLAEGDAVGSPGDHTVEPDHRLEADTEPRVDVFDVPLGVRRTLTREKSRQRTLPLLRASRACRHEHGEAVRVVVEGIASRILRALQLRDPDLRAFAQLAAVHDAFAPQHGLVREPTDTELQPPAQLVMLEDERWRLPPPPILRRRRARGHGRTARTRWGRTLATSGQCVHAQERYELAPQPVAGPAECCGLAGVREQDATDVFRDLPIEH